MAQLHDDVLSGRVSHAPPPRRFLLPVVTNFAKRHKGHRAVEEQLKHYENKLAFEIAQPTACGCD